MTWMHKISQKGMPLDPEAYKYEPTPHRLLEHQDSHANPFGGARIPNPQDATETARDYKGVHATEDLNWAAAYANNRAAPGDPPVVIEFATTQSWINDIDAEKDITDQLAYAIQEVLGIEGLKETISSGQFDRDYLQDVFDQVSAMEYSDFYDSETSSDSVGDNLQLNAVRVTADAVTEFFTMYYPDDPISAFYENFLKPIIVEGEIDQRLYGHFHNQMRFMEAIRDDEIVKVYKVQPWEDEIYDPYNEFDGNPEDELEERETGGVMRELVNQEEMNWFSPKTQMIWESPDQKPGPTFYHGTSLSRAQRALPFLQGLS